MKDRHRHACSGIAGLVCSLALAVLSSHPGFAGESDLTTQAAGLSIRQSLSDYYAEHGPPRPSDPAPRLLVIGIDGASWANLDPLIASGKLPQLARLKQRSRFGELQSMPVPESAISWTSMRTGVGPGEHGVFKFRSPTASRPSYWRELDRRGFESIVIAVPKVSAREPIRGVIIEGWTASRSSEYARPKELKPALDRAGFDPGLVMSRQPDAYIERMETRTEVALSIMHHEAWRHAFVVYEYGDTVAHRFHLDSPPWIAVHTSIDREIGRLVASMNPADAILVVSDHGWTHYADSVDLNVWLMREGFTGWTSSIFSGNSVGLQRAHGRRSRSTPDDREREIAAITERLRGLMDPDSGEPVIARVRRTAEVFPGPEAASAPLELLVDLAPSHHAVKATDRRSVFRKRSVDHHSRDGLYLLVAPGVAPGEGGSVSILDVAPTVLAFFGIEPSNDMAGVAMTGVGQPGSAPDEFTDGDDAQADGELPEPAPAPDGSDDELIEKLRSLGYVE